MEFKALSVGQEIYGELAGVGLTRTLTKIEKKKEVETNFKSRKLDEVLVGEMGRTGEPHEIKSDNGKSKIVLKNNKERVQEILKLLSICHDCEAEEASVDGKYIKFYQGASPDEITLVDFARDQGFEFMESNDNFITTKLLEHSGMVNGGSPQLKQYAVHKKVPFTSSRARMSLLFTDPDDGQIKLYIKGADSKIKERLGKHQNDPKLLKHVEDFLNRAAVTGLRTLLMAMRVIDKDEFAKIDQAMREADKDVKNREKRLLEIYEEFEQNLVLIGATCVEDKLQENV